MQNSSVMPTLNGKEVRAVSKSGKDITGFWLEDGTSVSYSQAMTIIAEGNATGLVIGGARDGSSTIHGVADGDPDNNLDNLPVQ